MPDFLTVWPRGTSLGGTQPTPTPAYPQPTPVSPTTQRQTYIAGPSLSGHRIVCARGERARYPNLDKPRHAYMLVGLTLGAASAGTEVEVAGNGEIVAEASWNLIPDEPVYVAEMGYLTQTPPETGWLRIVGVAQSPTSLLIQMREPIQR